MSAKARRRAKESGPTRAEAAEAPARPEFWTTPRQAIAVVGLLAASWAAATLSLVRENPTIDEVVHLPAGVTYWQTGTFKLYPHNPPLVKLLAALPVVAAGPAVERAYAWPPGRPYWEGPYPNKAGFAHVFQEDNAPQYLELFTRSRLLMPAFLVMGGLAIFAWSRRLFGPSGGLISLALWTLCPNVLAHGRLVTTDVPAAAVGVLATSLFWGYLRRPSAARAALAGIVLGMAQLTKFSLILLYGFWPVLWLIQEITPGTAVGRPRRIGRSAYHGMLMVALSILVIDIGYGFEGVGTPLGSLPFVSRTLTKARPHPEFAVPRPDDGDIYGRIRERRANLFVGTPLAGLPSPLPRFYLTGFDEQKLEADGIARRFLVRPIEAGDRMGPEGDAVEGYPVYLDGTLSGRSWWSYFLFALAYKVPEGTWALTLLAIGLTIFRCRARLPLADEAFVWGIPAVTLAVMSFGTNINLGLRYVLPIFPYVFVACGRLGPWAVGLNGTTRKIAIGAIGAGLLATAVATVMIHPHYLAYFNAVSGGTARGSEHLIDSNLDWGQDLVNLRRWLRENAEGERVGIAYFGQIHPDLFAARGEPIDWFLPPARPGSFDTAPPSHLPGRPAERLTPGLYAVSASLMRGLDWRVYDRAYTPQEAARGWAPWAARRDAYSYFAGLEPVADIGGSILIYRLTEDDVRRLAPGLGSGQVSP